MPVNPLDFFEAGQKVGRAKKSTFAMTADNVLGAFQSEQDRKVKQAGELDTYRKKKEIDTEASRAMFGNPATSDDMMLAGTSVTGKPFYRSKTYMKEQAGMRADAELQKRGMVGAGAQSGNINAAMQAANSARKARLALFPDDTPASFRRDIAATKGKFLSRATLSREAQNVAREYGIALDMYNRQVTGSAFSQPEFEQRVNQFKTDMLSNPEAAYDSLKRLEELNRSYLQIADPSGIYSGLSNQGQGSQSGGIEADRQQIQQAIASGEYAPDIIEAMKRDFEAEYGQQL